MEILALLDCMNFDPDSTVNGEQFQLAGAHLLIVLVKKTSIYLDIASCVHISF